jgi:hypothetical protein
VCVCVCVCVWHIPIGIMNNSRDGEHKQVEMKLLSINSKPSFAHRLWVFLLFALVIGLICWTAAPGKLACAVTVVGWLYCYCY